MIIEDPYLDASRIQYLATVDQEGLLYTVYMHTLLVGRKPKTSNNPGCTNLPNISLVCVETLADKSRDSVTQFRVKLVHTCRLAYYFSLKQRP